MDTDAAGIWHYSTSIRFVEAAEAELHRQLGIIDLTFGLTPRAHVEFDFHRTARFDDTLENGKPLRWPETLRETLSGAAGSVG